MGGGGGCTYGFVFCVCQLAYPLLPPCLPLVSPPPPPPPPPPHVNCVLLCSHTPKIPDSLLSRINVKVSGLSETDKDENVLLRARGGAEESSRAEVREECVGVQ